MDKPIVNKNAIQLINTLSPTNCRASCVLTAPATLRMPTSLALSEERAVVRLTKLMQAIIKMNKATTEKIYTFLLLPVCKPEVTAPRVEYRYTSFNGSRKRVGYIWLCFISLPAHFSRKAGI